MALTDLIELIFIYPLAFIFIVYLLSRSLVWLGIPQKIFPSIRVWLVNRNFKKWVKNTSYGYNAVGVIQDRSGRFGLTGLNVDEEKGVVREPKSGKTWSVSTELSKAGDILGYPFYLLHEDFPAMPNLGIANSAEKISNSVNADLLEDGGVEIDKSGEVELQANTHTVSLKGLSDLLETQIRPEDIDTAIQIAESKGKDEGISAWKFGLAIAVSILGTIFAIGIFLAIIGDSSGGGGGGGGGNPVPSPQGGTGISPSAGYLFLFGPAGYLTRLRNKGGDLFAGAD